MKRIGWLFRPIWALGLALGFLAGCVPGDPLGIVRSQIPREIDNLVWNDEGQFLYFTYRTGPLYPFEVDQFRWSAESGLERFQSVVPDLPTAIIKDVFGEKVILFQKGYYLSRLGSQAALHVFMEQPPSLVWFSKDGQYIFIRNTESTDRKSVQSAIYVGEPTDQDLEPIATLDRGIYYDRDAKVSPFRDRLAVAVAEGSIQVVSLVGEPASPPTRVAGYLLGWLDNQHLLIMRGKLRVVNIETMIEHLYGHDDNILAVKPTPDAGRLALAYSWWEPFARNPEIQHAKIVSVARDGTGEALIADDMSLPDGLVTYIP